ncbi:MFS transporter [Herbiconiux ginsengi]|uniref:Major Facilitator Superfamily protein n=1 Tax=Herbiconiux ginsengi TaxID=381665 RepID=A0A1H3TGC3_9MICO|nr:MFS transporter [Herbiconiux ginsengi]SDZ48891.1 Major Facilitator Superfamily protein [Herbiconiux ginsengi]
MEAARAARERRRGFAVCIAVATLTILDLSKVTVGVPSIESSLKAAPSELQLVVAGFALAFGLALIPAGRLGDLRSRKRMLIIGVVLFTLASALCALAPTIELLVVARIAQGVAAGIQMPQVLGIIQQLFQGDDRARAFGTFGATVGLATALGPALGGLLIAIGGPVDGWRWMFWMNVPLGIAAALLAMRFLPGDGARKHGRTDLDLVGTGLLGISTVSLMLPFVLTTGGPEDDPRRWLWLLLFAGAAAGLLGWERRYVKQGRSPVLDVRLFSIASYRNGLLVVTAYYAGLPALFLLTTLFLQQGLGLPPVFAGMVSIPYAVAAAGTAWLGGRLIGRYGRRVVLVGLVVALGGTGLIAAASTHPTAATVPWLIAAAMIVAGLGGGLVISPNQTLALAEVPLPDAGLAGSMTQVGQRVGTALGVAVVLSVFLGTLARRSPVTGESAAYHDAFILGLAATICLMAVALVFSLFDLKHGRRRAG